MLRSLNEKQIVVLPDLYIDASVPLPDWPDARREMDAIAARGGGNLPVGPVRFKVGGNAANLAVALARLGAQVHLISETDPLGAHLLRSAPAGDGLHLERVRTGTRSSATLALECPDANVMLSHAGPLLEFGPARLEDEDHSLIDQADAVACVNWSQNKQGTALLAHLSDRLAHREDALLYLDTGDPTHRPDDARALLDQKGLWQGVDVWGLNENELLTFTRGVERPEEIDENGLVAAARELADRLDVRLDLHTRGWAASVATGVTRVDADPSPARRLTGAGDAWNAGNLAGYLVGANADDRLRLAHEVATRFVTSEDGWPPRASDLTTPQHPIPK